MTNLETTTEFTKPKCALIGADGNIFNLIGLSQRALKNAGYPDKAKELYNRINSEAADYDQALRIIMEFVEVC